MMTACTSMKNCNFIDSPVQSTSQIMFISMTVSVNILVKACGGTCHLEVKHKMFPVTERNF
jgi:hypothetical protein